MYSTMSVRVLSFCAALLVAASSPAWAQPNVSKDALKKAYNEVDTRRRSLNTGAESAGKGDDKVAEAVAQWHVYRVTFKFERIEQAHVEFQRELNDILDKKNASRKAAYINLLGPAFVNTMKHVFDSTDIKLEPSVVIYAAQLLPMIAKLKQDNVSNYLVELIENPKTHDVVRLHALKAMKEVMPVRTQLDMVLWNANNEKEDFGDKAQNAKRKQDASMVDALTKYIERSAPNMQGDDLATLRFLRREAIIALAAAGAPAVTAHPKAPRRPLDGLVAPTLMKVLTKNGLQPPTSMNEKIEAAIGLCNLEYPWMPEYRPELAVYLVGHTLVDFTNQYNKELPLISTDLLKGRQPPTIGFKADGKRLELALTKMELNTKPDGKYSTASNPAATKMVAELRAKAKVQMDAIGLYRTTDAARLEDLTRWVENNRPKTGYPFKTLKSPEIPLDR
jgi:hypothetical protein